jgi:CarD family transcriptional regulator
MFEVNDQVVHPNHGVGLLTKIQTMTVAGVERQYYYIELSDGKGELMLPVKQALVAGLRAATSDPETILINVLNREPEELPEDYRKRHDQILSKIQSNRFDLVVEALRDLAWYEHNAKLSKVDIKLRMQAKKLLVSELAVHSDFDAENALQFLKDQLEQHVIEYADSQTD